MIAQIIHVWHLKHSVAVQYHNFFIAVHCEISFIIRSVSMWLFGSLGVFCGLFGIFCFSFFFSFSSFLQISFWRKQKRLLQIQEINSNCICCHSRTNIIFDISMHFCLSGNFYPVGYRWVDRIFFTWNKRNELFWFDSEGLQDRTSLKKRTS